jgi:LmbE family N-acetylglucosaminyl deacetylase
MKKQLIALIAFFLPHFASFAQPSRQMNAGEIKQALDKMLVVGNALYVAAHPDDENTRMITFLANEMKLRTAYLSLTRGDGGQNLIGAEVREELGLIRTQELLAARRIDGGEQFFSSANDFGFSKVPDETFEIWNREKVLSETVFLIRKFRPDVILTRFSPNSAGKTHGHHTASALLAVEAFHAAADQNRFPEQLKEVETWQAKRILWNTSWFFYGTKDYDKTGLLAVEVGMFNPLLGKSYGEIAAQSRSMHKSQGFGSAESRGNESEYFEHLAGEKAEKKLFEGVELSWRRIKDSDKLRALLEKAAESFNPNYPQNTLPLLLEARKELLKLQKNVWTEGKIRDLEQIILSVSGIWLELTTKDYRYAFRDSIPLTASCIVRNPKVNTKIEKIIFSDGKEITHGKSLPENMLEKFSHTALAPEESTQPFWLRKKHSEGMYEVEPQFITLPENPPLVYADFEIRFDDFNVIKYRIAASHKRTDPVEGEVYRPLEISPAVLLMSEERLCIFSDKKPKKITFKALAVKENFSGKIIVNLPENWTAVPDAFDLDKAGKFSETSFSFDLIPNDKALSGEAEFIIRQEGIEEKAAFVKIIDYKHIPTQTLFPSAKIGLKKIELLRNKKNIAYLSGAGDDVPKILTQIGYKTDLLTENDLKPEVLEKYETVILGVRAFNTLPRLKHDNKMLFDYVEKGGNLIVQYNTAHELVTKEIAPYKLVLSRERVTEENAPVEILNPAHLFLNSPNKITQKDFEAWVQERGLYFPNEWDEKFTPLIAANDKNEPARKGLIISCKHGKGTYTYTAVSWFRQLPAGVEGAIRLFVNLIEAR